MKTQPTLKKILLVVTMLFSCSITRTGHCSTHIDGVAFTSTGNIEAFIGRYLGEANQTVDLMMFIFEWKPLADELIKTHNRGVKVRILTDKRSCQLRMVDDEKQYELSAVEYLTAHDIPVHVYDERDGSIMHHKAVIIDKRVILLGSYNFQKAAQEVNSENFLALVDEEICSQYLAEMYRTIESKTVLAKAYLHRSLKTPPISFKKKLGTIARREVKMIVFALCISLGANLLTMARAVRANGKPKETLCES